MEAKCFDCDEKAFFRCHDWVYCPDCLSKHVCRDLEKVHVVVGIEDIGGCEMCGMMEKVVCACGGKKRKFCQMCFCVHLNTEKGAKHEIQGLLDVDDIPDEYALLKDRVKKIEKLKQSVNENILTVSDFEKNIEASSDNLKNIINKCFDDIESQISSAENYLTLIKTDLDQCKTSLDISEQEVLQKYSIQLTKSKTLKFFDLEIDLDTCFQSLKTWAGISLKSEALKNDSKVYFFKPRGKEMVIADLNSTVVSKKPFPKNFILKDSGSWCELPNKRVVYCGGVQASNFCSEAYNIDPNNFSIIKLPDMNQSRALPSVIYYQGAVYVFGGYSGKNLDSCEKFDIKIEKWKSIANMPLARSAFSAIVYNECIYMTGDSKNLDKYNPKTDTYESFKDILPEPAGYSSLACIDDTLYVIQNALCYEINLQRLCVTLTSRIPLGKWWSFFPAKPFGDEIFISRYDDLSFWSFNVNTKAMTKKIKL
ncbi:hypothetical protein SteCoe_35731 [Stentor coeruleus]|uniref:B box-type domain-containing protein n=1 Tax=Stentor coeruleus TaxID=5963 RepID=A0A1R2ARP9_9CILI|nr:hypothetical protein SteCoe_35731 [Stentor coeruleus]